MNKEPFEQGEFLGHFACPIHGGTDSLALYRKEKHIDGNCWAECGYVSAKKLKELGITDGEHEVLVEPAVPTTRKGGFVMTEEVREKLDSIQTKDFHGWPERRIPLIVNEFYGVYADVEGEKENKVILKEYCPAYDQNDQLVGFHVRDDAVKKAKNSGEKVDRPPFYSIGDVRASTKLFGQNKFQGGGKRVVLCSGQADARAVFTALNTERKGGPLQISQFITPVVSTQCGENSLAQIKSNYEWLSSFEEVIILYDQDEAGRTGAEKIAKMMKAGQAKIGKYRRKDACEHSMRGEWSEIKTAYFQAERYSPVDILHLAEMWEDFEKEDQNVTIPFPSAMAELNEKMNGGMQFGEITVIGALTSAGKSTFVNNIVYHLLENTEHKVGAFFLEGTKREVVRDLLSLDMSVNLRAVDRSELDMNELKHRFMNRLASKDRFAFVNHAGSINTSEIFDKLHYLAEVEGCKVIILDPLQAGVNSSDNSQIIEFMDNILKFAKKTDTCVIVVSHMRKPDSDDPHNVSEYQLLGSSSINQISFNTILISRDKLHPDARVRNATRLLLVKCRRVGDTGVAGWVRFDPKTSHLYATGNPYDELDEMPDELLLDNHTEVGDNDYSRDKPKSEWEVIDG